MYLLERERCNWKSDIGQNFWFMGKKINKTWILVLLRFDSFKRSTELLLKTLQRKLHKEKKGSHCGIQPKN